MNEWIILAIGIATNVAIAWIVSVYSCRRIDKEAQRRNMDDNMFELESLVNMLWTMSISDLSKEEVFAKSDRIAYVLEHLESRCGRYFRRNDSAKQQAIRALNKIQVNSTLDIESLAQEKGNNRLFETALSRSRRIDDMREAIDEMQKLLEKQPAANQSIVSRPQQQAAAA